MKNTFFTKFPFFLIVLCFVSPLYSMEIEKKKPLINNSLLKYLFLGLSAGGTLTLACNAYQDMQQIAQDKNHSDPESEAAAAFVIASALGYYVSKVVYNFWFIPSAKQTTIQLNQPSKTFKKKSKKTHYQKALQSTVKAANRKRDISARKNGRIKGY